jgi:hypothetical protein
LRPVCPQYRSVSGAWRPASPNARLSPDHRSGDAPNAHIWDHSGNPAVRLPLQSCCSKSAALPNGSRLSYRTCLIVLHESAVANELAGQDRGDLALQHYNLSENDQAARFL